MLSHLMRDEIHFRVGRRARTRRGCLWGLFPKHLSQDVGRNLNLLSIGGVRYQERPGGNRGNRQAPTPGSKTLIVGLCSRHFLFLLGDGPDCESAVPLAPEFLLLLLMKA
jgi:hypothetical protein